MWYLFLFPLALPFVLLGIYGGMCAVNRYFRDHARAFVFEPRGAVLYLMAVAVSGLLFAYVFFALYVQDSILALLLFVLLLFAGTGYLGWMSVLLVDWLFQALGPSQLPVAKTFDKGDGWMARRNYAEAEAQYRRDLAEEPLNTDALLRVCRAMEAAGRFEDAARELRAAHLQTLERRDEPELEFKTRQERLLRLTFALGDLLVDKLGRVGEACALYQTTLEILYGYPDADPLRDRLKALENQCA